MAGDKSKSQLDHIDDLEPFAEEHEMHFATPQLAYVRPVNKSDLPNADHVESEGPFYALHDADGRPLALFEDRNTAFVVARGHHMQPLSVH